jgi:hypothetical protein
MRWLAEGKVFSAGMGCEATAIDSEAALADTTPTFGIFAPSSQSILVVPIFATFSITTEGGAAPVCQGAVTKAAATCATALTKSGTSLSKQNCNSLFTDSGEVTALHTITCSALTTADYLSMFTASAVDNSISSAGANFANTVISVDFLRHPVIIAAGAAVLFYGYTGTSDSKWFPYFQWAELTAEDIY